MTFNEFFEKQIGFMDEFNKKSVETNHDPKIMVENLKKLASQMKENLEAYEKEGKSKNSPGVLLLLGFIFFCYSDKILISSSVVIN